MTDFLKSNVHLAVLNADVVVLDTQADAYFCLPGAGEALKVDGRQLTFTTTELRAAFKEAGFVGSEAAGACSVVAPAARRDLGVVVAEDVRLTDALLIIAAWLSMAFSYHGHPFSRLLKGAIVQQAAVQTANPTQDVVRLVAAFERLLPWLPFQGVCLYRAFLLRRILRWRGHQPLWVFGVQTWPFYAHCWLQIGETALDDTADRLAAYQPILVV